MSGGFSELGADVTLFHWGIVAWFSWLEPRVVENSFFAQIVIFFALLAEFEQSNPLVHRSVGCMSRAVL